MAPQTIDMQSTSGELLPDGAEHQGHPDRRQHAVLQLRFDARLRRQGLLAGLGGLPHRAGLHPARRAGSTRPRSASASPPPPSGAGSGYVAPTVVNNALDCLTTGHQLRLVQALEDVAGPPRRDDLVDQLGRHGGQRLVQRGGPARARRCRNAPADPSGRPARARPAVTLLLTAPPGTAHSLPAGAVSCRGRIGTDRRRSRSPASSPAHTRTPTRTWTWTRTSVRPTASAGPPPRTRPARGVQQRGAAHRGSRRQSRRGEVAADGARCAVQRDRQQAEVVAGRPGGAATVEQLHPSIAGAAITAMPVLPDGSSALR